MSHDPNDKMFARRPKAKRWHPGVAVAPGALSAESFDPVPRTEWSTFTDWVPKRCEVCGGNGYHDRHCQNLRGMAQ